MTKITKSIIRIVLPLFSLGIFLVASLVVLVISQGQTLDRGNFVQTGIIRVNSIPSDNVQAFINDQKANYADFRISNINPGVVNLRLTKEGYTPWEKPIKVEPGIVTDVYAQLYPNTIPFTKVLTTNINQTFFSQDGQYIYYTILNGTSLDGLWRLKLTRNLLDFSNTQQITQIIKFNEADKNELLQNNYKINPSRDNTKIIMQVGGKYYLYNLNNAAIKVDLEQQLGLEINNLEWLRNDQSVMFTQGNYAFEYDITTKEVTLIDFFKDSMPKLSVSSNRLFYIKDNFLMMYTNNVSSKYQFDLKIMNFIPDEISQVYTPLDNPNVVVLESNNNLIYADLQKGFIQVSTKL
jgi:hypothetical protein